MGTFKWPVRISGMDGQQVRDIEATVDTGAAYTALPGSLLRDLGIEARGKRGLLVADGRRIEMEYGEARATIDGESVTTIVFFGEDEAPALAGSVHAGGPVPGPEQHWRQPALRAGNLTNLTRLALNCNQLTGAIPSELGDLPGLSIIGLARNQLSGDLPASLSTLTRLSLHDNTGLSGELPGGFVNIDGLQRLAIANTGMCIPSGQAVDDWLAGIPDVPGRDGLTRCGSSE